MWPRGLREGEPGQVVRYSQFRARGSLGPCKRESGSCERSRAGLSWVCRHLSPWHSAVTTGVGGLLAILSEWGLEPLGLASGWIGPFWGAGEICVLQIGSFSQSP